MAAIAHADQVSVLELKREYGVITHLVRLVRVTGLTSSDYTVLTAALGACGISPGASLPGAGFESLVLTEFDVKLVDEDVGTCDVEVTYDHQLNEGQSLTSPPLGLVLPETQSSVTQKQSNKDVDGNLVTVSYKFPDNDLNFARKTQTVAASFPVMEAQSTVLVYGIRQVSFPRLVQAAIVGSTNSVPWFGGDVGTWLCTGAPWKPYNLRTPTTFKFRFEFQYDRDGWDPEVAFLDPRSGQEPPDVVDGVGKKTVRRYVQVNFEELIGQRVQGG